ncbi:ArnT family glycosyltransferase [uncultured Jatrophihabitans sp.]|uniref:ArnT family glycosyltransferase n=1 Tax=uncultured Jatrophihabitans sp. TaxID=1610747 RepID=UPI0035C9C897
MSNATDVRTEPASRAGPNARLSRWVWVCAAVQFVALIATSTRYGFHRDEMYFILCGQHPAFGYPDQPPLIPLLCAALHHLAPGSLLLLRLPSAIMSAATTVVAAVVARDCRGRGPAQVVAAIGAATAGFALAVGHIVSTTTPDLLSSTLVCWLVIRAVLLRSGPPLLWAGIVTGVGFEAKPQVAFVAIVLVLALLVAGPRWPLRSPWLWAGAASAAVLALPYVVWQAQHGWPQLTVAGAVSGTAEGGRAGFVPFQFVLVSPVFAPVWIAGLVAAWRGRSHILRFVPVAYAVLAVAYLLSNGKAYYLASVYPALLGIGAIPVAAWLARGRGRMRVAAVAAVVAAVVSAVIALPLLPADDLQGSATMALNPDQGETVGWQRFAHTVSRVWHGLPADQRAHTVIFTGNYGEAGAVDLLGARLGLPRAYSGHNALAAWGEPPASATQVVVLGYTGARDAAPEFVGCVRRARIDDGVGLDNDEQGGPVLVCRPSAAWRVLWPRLRHYD